MGEAVDELELYGFDGISGLFEIGLGADFTLGHVATVLATVGMFVHVSDVSAHAPFVRFGMALVPQRAEGARLDLRHYVLTVHIEELREELRGALSGYVAGDHVIKWYDAAAQQRLTHHRRHHPYECSDAQWLREGGSDADA